VNISFKKVASALMLAFTIAACGESPEDIAAKPAVVGALIEDSLQNCNTGPVNADAASYTNRLRPVLMSVSTQNLKTLQENSTTICLDQRLAVQDLGGGKRINGVFYNQDPQSSVVGVWDNGKSSEEAGFFEMTAEQNGSTLLRKLAEAVRDGKVSGQLMYGAKYRSGKSYYTKWKSPEDFNQDSISRNPVLKTPPLRRTLAGPEIS